MYFSSMHDARLDLARRDHLDIDALVAQRAEHAAGDADVRAHADADDRLTLQILIVADRDRQRRCSE